MNMLTGSLWKAHDESYVLFILEDCTEDFNLVERLWCRVLKISAIGDTVIYDTMFWPYLLGLAKTQSILEIK